MPRERPRPWLDDMGPALMSAIRGEPDLAEKSGDVAE